MKQSTTITRNKHELKDRVIYMVLAFLEVSAFLFFVFFTLNISFVQSLIGSPNATVASHMEIGAAPTIIENITLEQNPVTLSPGDFINVTCIASLFDNEGESDIQNVSAEFFDTTNSFFGDSDDNNTHYTNANCTINTTYDGVFRALANCSFSVYYYANPGNWNCTINVTDSHDFLTSDTNSTIVSDLLAIGVPDTINYGTVNATLVSAENQTNVTNYGNVPFNISVEGYAQTEGDGYAMNCSLGSSGFIAVEHEKFNLTNSTPGDLTLTQTAVNYTNLTTNPIVYDFELNYRQNDVFNEAVNTTYWRIYVPTGVAGNCTGNVIFGATQAVGV